VRRESQPPLQLKRYAHTWPRFIYYLSKFWELLDSIFQLQKARSLNSAAPEFLHYFHHAAVIVFPPHFNPQSSPANSSFSRHSSFPQVMCLNWIESNQSLQWLGLAFNTFVHVIMSQSPAQLLIPLVPHSAASLCKRARSASLS
jgi:hypothetical protein